MALTKNTLDPTGSGSKGSGAIGVYANSSDTLATMQADGYFDTVFNELSQTKMLLLVASDGMLLMTVTRSGTTDVALGALERAPDYEVLTEAEVLTAADSGKILQLSAATGFQITLPAVAAGLRFTMIGGPLEVTGSNHTIISNAAETNNMFGAVSAGGIVVLIDTHDTLTLVADKWLAGDWLEFWSDGVNWYVSGVMGVTVGITSA